MTITRSPWIDASEPDIAVQLEPFLSAIPIRDALGRAVRDAWVERCRLKPDPRPDHLVPFESLSPFDQETDRHIGDAVVRYLCGALPTAEPADLSTLGEEALRHSARLLRIRPHVEDAQADLVIQQASILLRKVFDALCKPRGLIAPPGAGQEVDSQQKGAAFQS